MEILEGSLDKGKEGKDLEKSKLDEKESKERTEKVFIGITRISELDGEKSDLSQGTQVADGGCEAQGGEDSTLKIVGPGPGGEERGVVSQGVVEDGAGEDKVKKLPTKVAGRKNKSGRMRWDWI